MNILVAVKRVVDANFKVRVKDDATGVETDNVKMSMNPFDEIALEEAIRLREQGKAASVIAVTIGTDSSQETLRQALALGADRAILIKTDRKFSSLDCAKILAHISEEEAVDLVILGKQSIDGDNNQTPQMLAGLLDWPQATFASKLVLEGTRLEVTREVDDGLLSLEMQLPAVVSTDLRLNVPRYTSLPNIMKAKQKPLQIRDLDPTWVSAQESFEVLSVTAPAQRPSGIRVDSVKTLVDKLQHEDQVL